MTILEQITEDLKEALKRKDEISASALRMAISNITNARIAKGSELSDDEVVAELSKDAKRHKESIAAFEKGQRVELAEKERAELKVISKYLPEQMGEEEVKKIIDEVISEVSPSGMSDMGKVMSGVMAKVGTRADGALVSSLVKDKLGAL
jgi:uncharacterized protein YqeY